MPPGLNSAGSLTGFNDTRWIGEIEALALAFKSVQVNFSTLSPVAHSLLDHGIPYLIIPDRETLAGGR